MEPKFKLPEFNTVENKSYTPRFKSTVQSGLFRQSLQPSLPTQQGTGLFGQPEQPQIQPSETQAQIASLQSQVDNLTKRLTEAEGEKADSRNWFEKTLNLPEGQVWWQDAFDLLDRSVRAVKEGFTAGDAQVAWDAFLGNRPGPFQEGYIEGSAFAVNTLGIATQEQIDADPTFKIFLDIAVDILADPLTYINPLSILRKVGLLSDTRFVTKFDEVTKTLRQQGLLKLTDDAMSAALTNATKAAREALEAAGKSADEIAAMLGKNIDEWDDVARNAYNASLEAAGVLDDQGFAAMLERFGQTMDDQGRVVFKVDNNATIRNNARKFIDDVQNLFPDKKITTLKQARKALKEAKIALDNFTTLANPRIQLFAQEAGMSFDEALDFIRTGSLRQGQSVPLNVINKWNNDITELRSLLKQSDTYTELIQQADDFIDTIPKLPKPKAGEVMEEAVTTRTRQLLQDKANKVFDNVYAVAGDAKSKANDIVFWVRDEKTGRYIQLRNRAGTPFKFEVKTPKKFSILNTNLRVVSEDSISKGARKLRDRTFRNSKKGQKLYQEWLEDVAIYRAAEGKPTLAISRGGELAKLPEDIFIEYANTFRRMMADISGANPKYTVTQYFQFLDDYYKALDKFAAQGKKGKKLIDAAEAAARKGKNYPPELIRTITLTSSSEKGQQAARELLKLKQMTDPTNAYGMIIEGLDGVDELLILQPDDFFKYSKFDSISIEASQKGASAGKITGKQTKLALYMTIDAKDVPRELFDNGWFPKELAQGVDEVIERVPRVVEEYVPGYIVRMLNGISKTNIPFIGPAADLVARVVDGFTFLFDARKGLTDDLTELIARIPAEDLQAAKVSIGKVQNLVDDITKRTKGRYSKEFVEQTIGDLVEQGWDGVTIAGRKMQIRQVFNRWALQFRKAGTAQFVDFASEVDFQNFVTKIADVLRAEGVDPNFIKLTRKDGFTLVEFAEGATAKEIDEFVQNLGTIADDVVDLGKGNLTSQQLLFAKEFNEPIQKIIEETVSQTNFLRELGFDFGEGVLGTGAYFRHAINPKMLQFLKNKSPASIKKFLDAGTDMLRDRIYIGSTTEINAAVREMFGINIDLFSTDAAYNFAELVRVASTKNEMSVVLKEILKAQDNVGRPLFEVIDDIESTARGMRRNFQILNGSFKSEFPNLFKNVSPETQQLLLKYFADLGFAEGSKVIAIQKSAYGVLKRLDNAYVVLPEFIKNYDQFMRFWKTFALITPGYHMRNFIGNISNAFIAGMPISAQSAYMFRASSDFQNYNRVLKMLQRGEDVSRLPKRVVEAFKRVDDYFRSGASQSHKGIRDLEIIKEGLRVSKGQKRGPIKKLGDWLLNVNYSLAEGVDDFQRYSLYRWAYDNADRSSVIRKAKKAGASASQIEALKKREAYKKIAESLFDYSHLTPFEKEYMKRLFPFYTFFKNNLVFQAKSLFERPQQFTKLYRSYYYYTESMTGMDIEDLPNYMTDNLWIPMPYRVESNDAEAIEWLRANLPISDFMDFVQNPFARGVQSITVPIKFAIELGTNRDVFTGQQIREFPGERSVYEGESFASGLRNARGQFSISQDPYIIKFLNDIGFRSLFNYGTVALDLIDFRQGNVSREELVKKLSDSLGITRVQELTDLEIASLYQNLDRLRDAKDLYEQENEGKLPSLKEIAAIVQEEEKGGVFDNLFN